MKIDQLSKSLILDESGRPLEARIRDALSLLSARFTRDFGKIRDEAVVASLFEKAGQAIARHERENGPIDRLQAFAWVTLRNLALSWMRSPSNRIELESLNEGQISESLLNKASGFGTVEEIENNLLFAQILATMTEAEQEIVILKKAGFSSQEIALQQGSSASAVNTMMCRLRKRLANVLSVPARKE